MVFANTVVVGRKTIALVYLGLSEIARAQKPSLFKIKKYAIPHPHFNAKRYRLRSKEKSGNIATGRGRM